MRRFSSGIRVMLRTLLITSNLLYISSCRLYLSTGVCADFMNFYLKRLAYLTLSEYFNAVINFSDQPRINKGLRIHTGIRLKAVEIAKVEDGIDFFVRVGEAALWHPPHQWHLPALEARTGISA
jgi:hypothetical protein